MTLQEEVEAYFLVASALRSGGADLSAITALVIFRVQARSKGVRARCAELHSQFTIELKETKAFAGRAQ